MKKVLLALFLVSIFTLLLTINLVYAAPSPWGFALNPQTKECAGYWAGDEFGYNPLPKGWEAYYPHQAKNIRLINSSFGICKISFEEFISDNKKINWEYCCVSFGFNPVNYKEFASQQPLNKELFCDDNLGTATSHLVFAIDGNNKECTMTRCKEGIIKETYSDKLEAYGPESMPLEDYAILNTSVGECYINKNENSNYSSCCEQLGYKFVSANIGVGINDKNDSKNSKNLFIQILLAIIIALITIILLFIKKRKKVSK